MAKHYLYSTWYWLYKQQKRHEVDPTWADFNNFISDLGDRPSENHRLHKVNKDLGYIRGNLVWREMLKTQPGFKSHSLNYQKQNPEKSKGYKLKSRFGITEADYQELLKKQKHSCAICGILDAEYHQRLSVDHCHTTGKIRGLLCSDCNFAIGHAKDSITRLEQAIEYLKKNQE